MMLAARIAWTHHERYDGGGYPRGLRGEEIQLEGRIVAICDLFLESLDEVLRLRWIDETDWVWLPWRDWATPEARVTKAL